MKQRDVVFTLESEADLLRIYDWIAKATSPSAALAFAQRIRDFCKSLSLASERGHRREDILPGLRIVGFERRVTIAFVVEDAQVLILRLFYGGRDWESLLG